MSRNQDMDTLVEIIVKAAKEPGDNASEKLLAFFIHLAVFLIAIIGLTMPLVIIKQIWFP